MQHGMVFCHACGQQRHESVVTCPQCGLPNATADNDSAGKGASPVGLPERGGGTRRKWLLWGVVVVFGLALGIGFALYEEYSKSLAQQGREMDSVPWDESAATGQSRLSTESRSAEYFNKLEKEALEIYEKNGMKSLATQMRFLENVR